MTWIHRNRQAGEGGWLGFRPAPPPPDPSSRGPGDSPMTAGEPFPCGHSTVVYTTLTLAPVVGGHRAWGVGRTAGGGEMRANGR